MPNSPKEKEIEAEGAGFRIKFRGHDLTTFLLIALGVAGVSLMWQHGQESKAASMQTLQTTQQLAVSINNLARATCENTCLVYQERTGQLVNRAAVCEKICVGRSQ